jgi:hypothetical protein
MTTETTTPKNNARYDEVLYMVDSDCGAQKLASLGIEVVETTLLKHTHICRISNIKKTRYLAPTSCHIKEYTCNQPITFTTYENTTSEISLSLDVYVTQCHYIYEVKERICSLGVPCEKMSDVRLRVKIQLPVDRSKLNAMWKDPRIYHMEDVKLIDPTNVLVRVNIHSTEANDIFNLLTTAMGYYVSATTGEGPVQECNNNYYATCNVIKSRYNISSIKLGTEETRQRLEIGWGNNFWGSKTSIYFKNRQEKDFLYRVSLDGVLPTTGIQREEERLKWFEYMPFKDIELVFRDLPLEIKYLLRTTFLSELDVKNYILSDCSTNSQIMYDLKGKETWDSTRIVTLAQYNEMCNDIPLVILLKRFCVEMPDLAKKYINVNVISKLSPSLMDSMRICETCGTVCDGYMTQWTCVDCGLETCEICYLTEKTCSQCHNNKRIKKSVE